MDDYSPTISNSNSPSSISYANPKVLEKRLQQQDDWAKLAQKQAAINQRINEQEKLQKKLKKEELEKNLFVMIQQKQSNKKHFDYNQRVKDYTEVKAVQEEYETQLRRAREERNDVKKTLANELVREMQFKEQERRRQEENDKQVESKILNDALNGLRKDSIIKAQKKSTINHAFNSHLQEKQEEKRRRYEQEQQEKDMERKNVNRMTYMEQNRMGAHMMHFQDFFEKQKKMSEIYMSTVGLDQKDREQQVNAYITRGVQNDNRKAEHDEAQKRLKRDHQTRSLSENVQIHQQEKEQYLINQRNSKKAQADRTVINNYYLQDYDKKVKQFKASQAYIYKNALDDQIRESGIRKIKASHEIPEDQKRMHFNHAENTLAKIDGRVNNNIHLPVKARALDNTSPFLDSPADFSPQNFGHYKRGNLSLNASSVVDLRERGNMSVNASPIGQPQVFQNGYITPNVRASLDNLMNVQNFSGKRMMPQQTVFNPITNPAPVVRKPYLNFEHVKEYQEKSMGYHQRNYKSLAANKSFVG